MAAYLRLKSIAVIHKGLSKQMFGIVPITSEVSTNLKSELLTLRTKSDRQDVQAMLSGESCVCKNYGGFSLWPVVIHYTGVKCVSEPLPETGRT
jgi:hypothetical protein